MTRAFEESFRYPRRVRRHPHARPHRRVDSRRRRCGSRHPADRRTLSRFRRRLPRDLADELSGPARAKVSCPACARCSTRSPRATMCTRAPHRQLRGGGADQARILRSVALLPLRRVRRRRSRSQRAVAAGAGARCRMRRTRGRRRRSSVVIGDTPLDVACAQCRRRAIDRGGDGQPFDRGARLPARTWC